MPESIIVHFATTGWDRLEPWLDARAARVGHREWHCPEANDPLLIVDPYEEHAREYAPEDLERLRTMLGGPISAAICLQLRRRHGDRSCDAAAELSIDLLRRFDGIVDDTFAQNGEAYWSLAELEAAEKRYHGRFLDCYRPRR